MMLHFSTHDNLCYLFLCLFIVILLCGTFMEVFLKIFAGGMSIIWYKELREVISREGLLAITTTILNSYQVEIGYMNSH